MSGASALFVGVARNDAGSHENICPFREASVRLSSANQGFLSAIVRDGQSTQQIRLRRIQTAARSIGDGRGDVSKGCARRQSSRVCPIWRERLSSWGEA